MYNLEGKYQKYLQLIKTVQDPWGFIESHECDSLLFSSLIGCVPDVRLDIKAAFDGERWHRRPLTPFSMNPCCGCWDPNRPENQVKLKTKVFELAKYLWQVKTKYDPKAIKNIMSYKGSTISRDMLVGLAWYAWHNKRLDIAESVVSCAMKNWGVMGEGDYARINIMPGLFATFCWISYRLGGPSRAWARWIPADNGAKLDDYQAHLQILHILLREELAGKSGKFDSIKAYHAARQPNNPLFQSAVGQDLKALELLTNERLWPSDRLPQAVDRKTQWIPQRDEGDDWKSVKGLDGFKHHSGGDFVFLYWLITRKYSITSRS